MFEVILLNVVLASSLVQGVPPLTDAQQVQLATAGDYIRVLDEGALYPLLRNAVLWEPGDEAGAVIPDYAQIRALPAEHRGRLFLIEGAFQRGISAGKYAQPGPWDGRAQQWVIKWGKNFEDVAVVELINPPEGPRLDQRVRLVARFYKVWNESDQSGAEASFLTFVGNTATVVGAQTGNGSGGSGMVISWPLLGMAVAVGFGLFALKRLRRLGKSNPVRPSQALRQKKMEQGEHRLDSTEQDLDESLPKNPADALAELHKRQEQKETSG